MNELDPLLDMTADIVSAYVSHNVVNAKDLPALISDVHTTLHTINAGPQLDDAPKPVPAVPIETALQDDFIICLEDGQPFKSLKRHLRSKFNMTPEQYREKWGLAHDYPMVAPSYARQRSNLAKRMGLGKGATESDA